MFDATPHRFTVRDHWRGIDQSLGQFKWYRFITLRFTWRWVPAVWDNRLIAPAYWEREVYWTELPMLGPFQKLRWRLSPRYRIQIYQFVVDFQRSAEKAAKHFNGGTDGVQQD